MPLREPEVLVDRVGERHNSGVADLGVAELQHAKRSELGGGADDRREAVVAKRIVAQAEALKACTVEVHERIDESTHGGVGDAAVLQREHVDQPDSVQRSERSHALDAEVRMI